MKEYSRVVVERYGLDPHTDTALLAATMGLVEEAGEVAGLINHRYFRNQPYRREQLVEEMGDLFFYYTLLCEASQITLAEIIQHNQQKVRS